jgi:phosphoribosylglycinamide formyltransferase-1
MERVNIAVFASGKGSNAEALLEELRSRPRIRAVLFFSDRENAGGLQLAEKEGIPCKVLDANEVRDGMRIREILEAHGVDMIVLAGYFRKIPEEVIEQYRGRILNVHPALLPEFGGKGMYGRNVHEAVLKAGKEKSGITVHLVDEVYDNGAIIFQKECPVYPNDTTESLSERVKSLEHRYYPARIIERAEELLSE